MLDAPSEVGSRARSRLAQSQPSIGTRLIRALIEEAASKGQDLVLDVLAVNHRAQALYQRLGLTEVARHGDGNVKITMRTSHANPHISHGPPPA